MDKLKLVLIWFIVEVGGMLESDRLGEKTILDTLVKAIDADILQIINLTCDNEKFKLPYNESLEQVVKNRFDLFVGVPKEILVSGLELRGEDSTILDKISAYNSTSATRSGAKYENPSSAPTRAVAGAKMQRNFTSRNRDAGTPLVDPIRSRVAPKETAASTTYPATTAHQTHTNTVRKGTEVHNGFRQQFADSKSSPITVPTTCRQSVRLDIKLPVPTTIAVRRGTTKSYKGSRRRFTDPVTPSNTLFTTLRRTVRPEVKPPVPTTTTAPTAVRKETTVYKGTRQRVTDSKSPPITVPTTSRRSVSTTFRRSVRLDIKSPVPMTMTVRRGATKVYKGFRRWFADSKSPLITVSTTSRRIV